MLSPLRLRTARLSRLPHLGVLRTPVRTLRSLAQLENLDQIQPEERPAFKQAIESARETFSASATTFKKMSASSAKALSASNSILLTLSCPDQPGIVHKVTGFLAERQMNILDSAQFGDPTTKRFFMRVHASGLLGDAVQSATPEQAAKRLEEVRAEFESTLAKDLDMQFELHREVEKPRTLIMVSKIGRAYPWANSSRLPLLLGGGGEGDSRASELSDLLTDFCSLAQTASTIFSSASHLDPCRSKCP